MIDKYAAYSRRANSIFSSALDLLRQSPHSIVKSRYSAPNTTTYGHQGNSSSNTSGQRYARSISSRRHATPYSPPPLPPQSMLLVSACTGRAAMENYCNYQLAMMDLYAKRYAIDHIQVVSARGAALRANVLTITRIPTHRSAATWIQSGSTPG